MNTQTLTLYHNPRCSKSRQALVKLESSGLPYNVIDYQKTPLTLIELKSLATKLNLPASKFIRKTEALYKSLSLKDASEEGLLKAMVQHPKLIERPILESDSYAVVGRPVDNINSLLEA